MSAVCNNSVSFQQIIPNSGSQVQTKIVRRRHEVVTKSLADKSACALGTALHKPAAHAKVSLWIHCWEPVSKVQPCSRLQLEHCTVKLASIPLRVSRHIYNLHMMHCFSHL